MIPVIIIIVLGTLSYSISAKQIRTTYRESATSTIEVSGKYLELGLKGVANFIMQLSLDADTVEYYSNEELEGIEVTDILNAIKTKLTAVKISDNFINTTTLIGKEGEAITSISANDFRKADIKINYTFDQYNADLKKSGKAGTYEEWVGSELFFDNVVIDEYTNNIACIYTVPITSKMGLGRDGYIFADVSKENIARELDVLNSDSRMFSGFITADGVLTTCNNSELLYNVEDTVLTDSLFAEEEPMGIIDTEYNDEPVMVIYNKIAEGQTNIYPMIRSIIKKEHPT